MNQIEPQEKGKFNLPFSCVSPITLLIQQANDVFNQSIEKDTMEIISKYGIQIDKEALIKALQYDRHQYEKGFFDGVNSKRTRRVDTFDTSTMSETLKRYSTARENRNCLLCPACDCCAKGNNSVCSENFAEWLYQDVNNENQ